MTPAFRVELNCIGHDPIRPDNNLDNLVVWSRVKSEDFVVNIVRDVHVTTMKFGIFCRAVHHWAMKFYPESLDGAQVGLLGGRAVVVSTHNVNLPDPGWVAPRVKKATAIATNCRELRKGQLRGHLHEIEWYTIVVSDSSIRFCVATAMTTSTRHKNHATPNSETMSETESG
jgi:hypothetical protein